MTTVHDLAGIPARVIAVPPDSPFLVVLTGEEYARLTQAAKDLPADLVALLQTSESPIRAGRAYRGLSQRDLAKVAGTTQANVSALELRSRTTSVQTLWRIARALRVPMELLIQEEGLLTLKTTKSRKRR